METLLESIVEEKKLGDQIAGDIATKSKKRDLIRDEIVTIDQKIAAKTGSEYLALVSRIAEAKAAIDGLYRSIDRARRDKEEADRRVSDLFAVIKRQEDRVSTLDTSMRNLMIDRTNLSMTITAVQKEYDRIVQAIARETKGLEEEEKKLEHLRSTVQSIKEERGDLLRQQDLLIERSRMRSAEYDRLTSRILAIESDIKEKEEDIAALTIALSRLTDEKREHDQKIAVIDTEFYTKREEHDRLIRQIRDLKVDIGKKEAQQQAQGRYNRAMEAVLEMDGVFGTIGELATCKSDYATALSVAAGAKIHFVVVESDQVAAEAIRYLQEHKLGRVTFLPLNKLNPKPLPSLPHGSDVIGFALDLLDYDPKFESAFRVVFGSTLVIDTLEHARKRIGSARMVTLDGSLLEPSGTMTGGSLKKDSGGFGSSTVDEVKQLSSHLAILMSEEQALSEIVKAHMAERERVQGRRLELEGAIVRAKGQLESAESSKAHLLSEKESLVKQRDEAAGVSGSHLELAHVEKTIEEKNKAICDIQTEIDDIIEHLSETGIPLLYEQRDEAEREINEIQRRLQNKEQELGEARMELGFAQKTLEEERLRMEQIREQIKRYDEEIEEYQCEIEKRKQEISDAERTAAQFSEEIEVLRTERSELSRKVDLFDNEVRECIGKREKVLLKIESMEERLGTLNSEISLLAAEAGDCTTDLSEEEIEAKSQQVIGLIDRLGDVNMRAIEEYDQVHAVVAERMSRIETLQREMKEIKERIEFFSKKKYEAFHEAFTAIDANFRDIFSRLTMGSGQLILENPEDPFTGGLSFAVQPRDKKVHHLSALSGGEKSLTTLAFIFSIQRYIPAPFYAFDEVDMNLDGSNVVRIAEMIRELSATSQFINISLRKPMIDAADRVLGVTIRPDKTSLVTGVSIDG